MTDLRVQLYKKRQQQGLLQPPRAVSAEENVHDDFEDRDSLENARVTSSDEEETGYSPSKFHSRTTTNRIVQKSSGKSPISLGKSNIRQVPK